jgi:uncharacterized protein YceK
MSSILKVTRSISNDVWKIVFDLDRDKLSVSDKELIAKFGEPTIDVGGTFLAETENSYTLPNKYIRIKTDLPYAQTFDTTSAPFDTATQIKAEAYQTAFVERYVQAVSDLRANNDTFTGEFLVNL